VATAKGVVASVVGAAAVGGGWVLTTPGAGRDVAVTDGKRVGAALFSIVAAADVGEGGAGGVSVWQATINKNKSKRQKRDTRRKAPL
jgi:hypothetical protein